MKISIVTISFNQAQFLRQCIDSVLGQGYPDVEYIIVDAGSTDGSREIIDSYGDKIIRIYEADNGPADGLNNGFSFATGDIYYFINSDDFLLPGTVDKIMRIFEDDQDVEVVLSGGIRVDRFGEFECNFFPSKASVKSYVNGAVTFFQQGMFFKSELFEKIGGFNIHNRTCWDGELLFEFLRRGTIIKRFMIKAAAFRIYAESITGSQRLANQAQTDHLRMYQEIYGPEQMPFLIKSFYYRCIKLLCDPLYIYKRCIG
jgi:glycosyltransferase involved in cell wall biosynthesis